MHTYQLLGHEDVGKHVGKHVAISSMTGLCDNRSCDQSNGFLWLKYADKLHQPRLSLLHTLRV